MNDNYTREIDLINVIWKCFMQWKPALVVAIVFAILVSGGMYARSLSSYNSSLAASEESAADVEALKAELTDEELEAVDNAAATAINIRQRKEYVLNSALMHMDPYATRTLFLNYTVERKDGKPVTATIDGINTAIKSNTLNEKLADVIEGVDEAIYAAELVSSSYTSGDLTSIGALNVKVMLTSDTDEADVEAAIDDYINSIAPEGVSVSKASSEVDTVISFDLANSQKSQRDTITSLSSTLTTLESALDDNQTKVYEAMISEEESVDLDSEDEAESAQELTKPSLSAKYMALGFVLGIFLYACLVLLLEIIKKTVDSATEVSDCYGIRSLGEIHNRKFTKGLNAFIYSQFIYNLKNKNKGNTDELLADIKRNAEELARHKELISVKTVNISGQADAPAAVTADDAKARVGLVLAIESGVSTFKNVEKTITKARDFEIPILGVYSIE